MLTFLLLLRLIHVSSNNEVNSGKKLKMVNLVYRHGARAPDVFYPNDPYKERNWPNGAGQLTQNGMRLMYELGKFYKQRYIADTSFINQQYLHKEVFVQSSDADRCIQSALTQLAGMYPPTGYQIWNSEIQWQPIPVHTIPKHDDVFLRPDPSHCPRLQQLWAEKQKTPEYKKKVEDNAALLKTVSKKSGKEINAQTLYMITDAVKCEKAEGLKMPDWIDKIWNELSAFDDWLFVDRFSGGNEIGRLLGGSLLAKINENMKMLTENKGDKNVYKLNMWSGHDNSMMSLCAALGFKCHQPPFASSIMIELYHSDKHGGYTVEIWYRKDNSSSLEQFKLKGCESSCPLDKFLELTKVRTTTDRRKLCNTGQFDESHLTIKILIVFLLGCTLMCMFIVTALFATKRISRLRKKLGYRVHMVGTAKSNTKMNDCNA